MADEVKQPEQVETSETPIEAVPTDFREYDHWRRTGELPQKAEPATAATPQVKTEPQSGADDHQADDDEETETGRQRPGSRQRKIDKLTRENEELRRQLAAAPKPAEEKPKEEPAAPGDKPKLANYKTLEEYQEALTDWKLDQREKAKKEADAKATAEAAAKKLQTEWDSRQEAARAAHADYDEVLKSTAAPDGPGVQDARQAMLEDESGPEILYYLATHPDEMKRIAAMSPHSAVREIGRLSVMFNPPSGTAETPKPRAASAPKPAPPPTLSRPAKTASDSIHDEDLARTNYAKWERIRVQQLKG